MENVLVAGATGTTGNKVVNLLKESQYFNPVAMVRKPEQKEQFHEDGIDCVLTDLEKDVADAFNDKQIQKVVFAAGSGGKKVEAVDRDGAIKLIKASKQNNIHKFVMLSSMGADRPEQADELKEYLKAKHEADEFLKNSGINYCIVRPGSLTDEKLTNTIKLEEKIGEMGEISRENVAQTLVHTLNDDVANGATFEIIKGDTLIGKALDKVSTMEA